METSFRCRWSADPKAEPIPTWPCTPPGMRHYGDRLVSVLTILLQIDDYEPKRTLVVTPAKMRKFYEETRTQGEIYPWSSKSHP